MRHLETDTIAAIATPPGESGLAIVRLSGNEAVEIVARLSRRPARILNARSHTVQHQWLCDTNDRSIDEVLVTIMRSPQTFTAEDVVEIGVHGGILPARRVLRALLERGARIAERGEFTRRAFLNGRIDLSRAEAVADLISARTDRAADAALSGVAGGIAGRTEDLENRLLDLLARLEVNLDFNEDVEAAGAGVIGDALGRCREELEELERRAPWGRRLRDGVSIVLVGRPNVGKSSLFNALLEDERALVSPAPGTTRDYLDAWIDVDGVPAQLIDTAGQRPSGGGVEAEGVRRSRELEDRADLRLVVLDSSEALADRDREILERTVRRPRLTVANKTDLGRPEELVDPSGLLSPGDLLAVSARTGDGLAGLRQALARKLVEGLGREPEDGVLPNERHADAIRRARTAVDHALASWNEGASEELLAGDIRDATMALGEISGRTVDEEVLDRIFTRFCIGK